MMIGINAFFILLVQLILMIQLLLFRLLPQVCDSCSPKGREWWGLELWGGECRRWANSVNIIITIIIISGGVVIIIIISDEN